MNLRVRIKNPVFWVQLLLGVCATVLAYAGLTAADMTSWGAVWGVVRKALTNPYCLFLIASNVWNALNDPTTSGLTDSDRARQYEKPLEL
ncbi:phage holin [Candidatus Agathobaculum pullicola]|uniref:phage holin n=1 Tax=Candidatus Agathobaculum pullicola TaxID=2838426 RepID=UPI003F93B44A